MNNEYFNDITSMIEGADPKDCVKYFKELLDGQFSKKLCHETYLHCPDGNVAYITYHGNAIITYEANKNSVKLTNTEFYLKKTTSDRIWKLFQVRNYKPYGLMVTQPTRFNLELTESGIIDAHKAFRRGDDVISSYLFVYEGAEFIYENGGYYDPKVKEWYDNNTHNLKLAQPELKDLYNLIYKQSLKEDLLYYATLNTFYYSANRVYVTKVKNSRNYKQPKLAQQVDNKLREILDKYDLFTEFPLAISSKCDPHGLTDIEHALKLQELCTNLIAV